MERLGEYYIVVLVYTDFLTLIALVVLFTGILIIIWHIIIGGIVFNRIIKRIKRQYDLENKDLS